MRKIKELKNKLNEKYYVDFDTFFTAENKNIIEGDFFHNYLTQQDDSGRTIKYKLLKVPVVGGHYSTDHGIGTKVVIITKPWLDDYYTSRNGNAEFNKDDFIYSRYIYSAKYGSYYYKDSSSDEVFYITTDDRITIHGESYFGKGELSNYAKKDKLITDVLDTYCTEVSGAAVDAINDTIKRYHLHENLSHEVGFTSYGIPFDKYFGDNPAYNVLSMSADEVKKIMFKVLHTSLGIQLFTVYTPDGVSYPIKGYIQEELGIKPKQSFEKSDILHTLDEPLVENSNNKSVWEEITGYSIDKLFKLGFVVKTKDSMTTDEEVIPIDKESLRIIRNYIIPDTDLFEADDDTIKKTLIKVKDQDKYYILPKYSINGKTIEVDAESKVKAIKLVMSNNSLSDYLRSKSKAWLLRPTYSGNFAFNSYDTITETSPGVVNNKYKKYSMLQLLTDDIPELAYLTDEFLSSRSNKVRIYSDTATDVGYYGRSFYYYVPIDPTVWDMTDEEFEKLL